MTMPRHKFWGAGEPDCPQDLKAPNGELHTMRCKVCGDGWRKSVDVCFAGPTHAHMDAMRAALREIDPCAEGAYTDEQIARLIAASPDQDFRRRPASSEAAPSAEGWRSITTAPKDGRHMLLALDEGYIAVGYFDDDPEFRRKEWIVLGSGVKPPTHWMPLPQPPQEQR